MFVVALALTGACAVEDGDGEHDGLGAVAFDPDQVNAPPPVESVSVDYRTGRMPRYLDESQDSGPCACDTPECIDEWVVVNFGCNICVQYVCDGSSGHACNVCEEPNLGSSPERWRDDATRTE